MDIWNTACGICKDNGYPHISSFFAKRQETNTPVFKGSVSSTHWCWYNHVFNIKAK